MARDILVRLPVTVPFGTDEEFDLRVELQRELTKALVPAEVRRVGGDIDEESITLRLSGILDPERVLAVVKSVLAAAGLLNRAVVVLEAPSPLDADERECRVLWPAEQAASMAAG